MANPHKGEVEFKAGGDSYKLSYSANAIVELEDALDMSVNAIGEKMQDRKTFRMGTLRTILQFGLIDHQPDVDAEKVKTIFKKLRPGDVLNLVTKAFDLAFKSDDETEAKPMDPQTPGGPAADGTGTAS